METGVDIGVGGGNGNSSGIDLDRNGMDRSGPERSVIGRGDGSDVVIGVALTLAKPIGVEIVVKI